MRHVDVQENLRDAFFHVCNQALAPKGSYVSLYCDVPYYGGPEEGGWWGKDTYLIAYQLCVTQEEAEAKQEAIGRLAKELNTEEKRSFGNYCLQTMEWCEARGLDADFLPEVDGESHYFVIVEETPGSQVRRGGRHYE